MLGGFSDANANSLKKHLLDKDVDAITYFFSKLYPF